MPVELLCDLPRSWTALLLNHQLSANNGAGVFCRVSGSSRLDSVSSIVSVSPHPLWSFLVPEPHRAEKGCSGLGSASCSDELLWGQEVGSGYFMDVRSCMLACIFKAESSSNNVRVSI